MNNVWESLFAATLVLASARPIKQRLVDAYTTHLARLDTHDLPCELREDFDDLSHQLSSVNPMRGETAVQATVRKMSDVQASAQAVRIVGLLGTLDKLGTQQSRQPVLRAVNSE